MFSQKVNHKNKGSLVLFSYSQKVPWKISTRNTGVGQRTATMGTRVPQAIRVRQDGRSRSPNSACLSHGRIRVRTRARTHTHVRGRTRAHTTNVHNLNHDYPLNVSECCAKTPSTNPQHHQPSPSFKPPSPLHGSPRRFQPADHQTDTAPRRK